MKKIFILVLLVLFCSGSVFSGTFEDTLNKAEQGSVSAQSFLGFLFCYGQGVQKDVKQAFYWYKKAAEQGDAFAQFHLAYMYRYGEGTTQDYKQAIYWYKKSAEQGKVIAQNSLAIMYYEGEGTTQDYKQAFYWYKKSAEQGYAGAQFHLALMYDNGEGITQDYKQAFYWYKKAAEQGDDLAQFNLAIMYDKGEGTTQDYKQAFYWYKKAAEQGHAGAQNNLALMYDKGEGTTQDYKQAFYWYKKSAEQGDDLAQFNLAIMYDKGEGTTQDYKQAFYWYKKSAEQGDDVAQFNLAILYYDGKGTTQNYKLAYVWESLAAAQGHKSAIKNRDITAKKLSPQQLSEAQDLAAQTQYKIDNPVKSSSVANPTPTPNRRAPTSLNNENVRWVQRTLKNLGYDPGLVDGVMGVRTRSAIISFQTDLGVAPTGTIDEILFAQLRQMIKINQESPQAKTDPGKLIGSGTGFIITRDGYILTCHHVIKDANEIKISSDGNTYPAKLISKDSNNDLALLKIAGSFQAIAFASKRSAKMGQEVFTIGFPNPGLQGVSAKFTEGTISSLIFIGS